MLDEHVGHGPIGFIIPAWYLAPLRRDVAGLAWELLATVTGAAGDGPVEAGDDEQATVMLAQLAGEFADAPLKARIWDALDARFEPTWDRDAGEFTLGFGLGEEHPRGQLNARAMAGWVCEPGAWTRVFDEPNVAKFDEPTVVDVDFPRVALSRAHWDGSALHLAGAPQNASVRGSRTQVRVTGVQAPDGWTVTRPDGERTDLPADAGDLMVELVVDGRPVTVRPAG